MFKKLLFLCVFLLAIESLFADNISATIEINGITVNGGLVYVAVYSNENDYKAEKPCEKFTLNPVNSKISHTLELPNGEYVISVFQDTNSNENLDTNIFGIPTEPIGITNYSLMGPPGGFNKLKTPINNSSKKLIINLGKVKALGVI
jgi:uncharacterized protein (DUF2141 family)